MTDMEKLKELFTSFNIEFKIGKYPIYIETRHGWDGDYEVTYYFNEDGSYKETTVMYSGF